MRRITIRYRTEEDDGLYAALEKRGGDGPEVLEFRYRRVGG